jgi:cytosine deaminase
LNNSSQFVISNCRLRRREGLWRIVVERGKVASVERDGGKSGTTFDACGSLATESFVVAHIHLDKVLTAGRAPDEALDAYQSAKMDSRRAVEVAARVKAGYTEEDIASRARVILNNAAGYGVTHMRAFADTDSLSGLKAVNALLKLRKEFRGSVSIQVVAFPQQGVQSDPGAEEYVEKAVEKGADVVGGIPWLERTTAAQQKHIEKMFEIAARHDRPVAMLVDDAPDRSLRTLEMLARTTVRYGWQGRVQACHARAMGVYTRLYAAHVAELCARAGIGVVLNPHTGPCHAPLSILEDAGVKVALGQDDCSDAYYPYGRCNMLEVAFLSSHLLRMMRGDQMERLYDMVTISPAEIIGLQGFGLRVGNTANLVVLEEKSTCEALMFQSRPKLVMSHGSVVRPGGQDE